MSESLEIPVQYKNEEITVRGHSVRFGYTQHIIIDINGETVTIERDEEGNYRALLALEKASGSKVDLELLKEVMSVLESL